MSIQESHRARIAEPRTIVTNQPELVLPPDLKPKGKELRLSPVDLIIKELNGPKKFSRTEKVFILKAHGLSDASIGEALGRSGKTITNSISEDIDTSGLGSIIGVIVSLKSDRITPLLTKGLNFDLYKGLTPSQQLVLKTMSSQDMWDKDYKDVADRLSLSEQTVKNHSVEIYSRLEVRKKVQAIVYRILIPEKIVGKGESILIEDAIFPLAQPTLSAREETVRQLMTEEGRLSNTEIAQRLNLKIDTLRNSISRLYRKLGVSDRAGLVRLAHEQK